MTCKNGETSVEGFTKYLSKFTTKSKLAGVAVKALASAGNVLLSWAITKGIELAVTKLDDFFHSAQKTKKRVEDLTEAFNSALSTANTNGKRIEEIIERYDELSDGVGALGQNLSLTDEEYEEHNKLVSEITNMFPELITGYTDEGTAIINLKDNVNQLRDSYKEAQQEAYRLLVMGEDGKGTGIEDVLDNWENFNKSFSDKKIDFGKADAGGTVSYADAITSLKVVANNTFGEFSKIWNDSDRIWESFGNNYGYILDNLGLHVNEITEEDFKKAQEKARYYITLYTADMDKRLSSIKLMATALLNLDVRYEGLDSDSKAIASKIINSIDAEVANRFDEPIDLNNYVQKLLDVLENEDVKKSISGLFALDLDNLPVSEIKKQVDKYTDIISSVSGDNPDAYKKLFGFDNLSYDRLTNSLTDISTTHGIVNIVEYEKLLDYTEDFNESLTNLWLTSTRGARSSAEAILLFRDALKEKNSTELNPFTTLSEDQKSAIETYKSTLTTLSDAITSSLTGLDAFDTTSLMTEFPDYDWSGYVSGAKSLNDVLNEIGEKSLETVLAQFKDLEGVEPLLDDLQKKFEDAFSFRDDITKNLGAYHELMDVLDRVTKGEVLQADEITELINKYGDLADAVEIVEGGYSLEEDAIKNLINTFVDSSNTYIAQEMRKTKALIEETKKRIKVLMTERKALDALSEENTPKFGYDGNGKPILGATGRNTNVPTLKNMADERYAELSKYLSSLEEEYLGYEETMRDLFSTKSKNKSSSSDSTSDFTEQLDWAAQSISVFSREVTNLQEKFSNTKGYKAQKAALDDVIGAQETLKEGYQSAAKLYSSEYTKSLNAGILAQQSLSNAVKEKIESGETWSIEDFIDKNVKSGDEGLYQQLYNAIQESIDWYNKRNDASDNAVKVGFEINENELKKLTLDIEHQEAISNRLTTAQERYTDSLSKQLKYGGELYSSESERYNLLIKEAKAQKDYVKAKQLELEKEKTLNEIRKENFDKISSYYGNRISTNDAKSSKVDSQIALDEAQGRTIGSTYYKRQNDIHVKNIEYLEKQRDKQMESLKTIRMYTDEWYDARQALIETNDEIIKTTTSIVENNNMIRQLRWDNFDGLLDEYSELTNESDFFNDLLDAYEKIDDATGKLNENGISSNALHLFNYDTDMYQADELGREIARLDKEFKDDTLNSDYLERRKELVNNRYEMIRAAQSEREAVINLIKEGIQKEIDIMADLVAKKKEALDAEKDLYDYRKSITEKQKDISKIQRQIVALEGDDSLENQKRLRELRSQLADAQEDLSDTQYDRSISDQKEALDDMLSKYREDMEAYMKDSNALFEHAIAGVNASSDESMQNIKKVAQEVGMEVSDTLAGSFRDAEEAVSSYKGTFEDLGATAVRNLGSVKDKWDEATVAAELYSKAASNALLADDWEGQKLGSGGNAAVSGGTLSVTTGSTDNKKEKETQDKIAKIQSIISNASVMVGDNGAGTQINKFVLGYQDALNGNGNKLSWDEMAKVAGVLGIKTDAATVASSSKIRSQILKALEELIGKNLKDLSGFSTGGVVKSTMGKDDSLIKVKKGETVLTEKFTQILPQTTEKMQAFINKVRYEHENTSTGYQIGENPLAKMQKQIERETRAVQEFISNNYNATPTITGDIHIHLDGSDVTDFKSFRKNLDDSKSFIQHMVLDEMFGKGQLSYKKYKGI